MPYVLTCAEPFCTAVPLPQRDLFLLVNPHGLGLVHVVFVCGPTGTPRWNNGRARLQARALRYACATNAAAGPTRAECANSIRIGCVGAKTVRARDKRSSCCQLRRRRDQQYKHLQTHTRRVGCCLQGACTFAVSSLERNATRRMRPVQVPVQNYEASPWSGQASISASVPQRIKKTDRV